MACTCSKCNPNKPCGCADSALQTPCSYTDCSVGSERCADIQCAECVSYCGTSFQIQTPGGLLKISQGERLDMILQKLSLMIANGLGTCTADNVLHAPYNVYLSNITNTTVDVLWNGESTLTTQVNVFYTLAATPGMWQQANTTSIAPGVLNFQITNLTPTTDYKVKIEVSDGATTCDSVEVLFTTI